MHPRAFIPAWKLRASLAAAAAAAPAAAPEPEPAPAPQPIKPRRGKRRALVDEIAAGTVH